MDKDTSLVNDKLPTVLEYLFTNYGTIQSEQVKWKEQEQINLTLQPSDPMVILYCPIQQLMKLATSDGITYSKA